eukprot:1152440-Pelagomonas_calceolata.AAC.9
MTQAGRSCSIESELQTAGLWTFESLWCERGVSRMSEADLKDEDFRAYLASSSGDDEDDEEQPTVYGGPGGVQQGEGAGQGSNKKQEKAAAAASLRDRYRFARQSFCT